MPKHSNSSKRRYPDLLHPARIIRILPQTRELHLFQLRFDEEEMLEKIEKVEPIKSDAAPGRNDPCPCGSGKKFKKCCGAK